MPDKNQGRGGLPALLVISIPAAPPSNMRLPLNTGKLAVLIRIPVKTEEVISISDNNLISDWFNVFFAPIKLDLVTLHSCFNTVHIQGQEVYRSAKLNKKKLKNSALLTHYC